jgi:hypothetical protein
MSRIPQIRQTIISCLVVDVEGRSGGMANRDGNMPVWRTGAYGLAYDRPGQARLFS